MAGFIEGSRGIPKKIYANYGLLNPHDRTRAESFFKSQTLKYPRSSWMELRFLQTLGMVAKGATISKIPAKDIQPVDAKDRQYVASHLDFGRSEEHFRDIGKQVIENGDLMAIDLCAGMATGFGGNIAKASVRVQMDARGAEAKGVTYLDIKRSNYLDLQKTARRHFIATEMVSDTTIKDVKENLQAFADSHNMKLVIIDEGTPVDEMKRIWQRYKDKWDEVIIVPIVRQPTTLHISKDGRSVDGEYMKGHGDFYDVVKHQLKDVMEVMGIKYVFSSNIDNTGALVDGSILGYFVEQMQQEKIEAIMEAAEKYEGDKGGVPALVGGKFTLLEGAFVPDEWKDRFNGREVFPVFNTNTFWFKASALLNNEFNLPLLTSKIIDDKWLKIESVMGHGLESLKWKALVVDRGLRFLPAKYLTDVWVGRTNWIRWFRNRLMPIMRDGKYVPKPLLEVSKMILGGVNDLNSRIFGFGAYDSMKYLNTLIMGGEGKHFNESGDYITKCAVSYVGDVAIIFEYKEGRPSGTLIIQGASDSDEITLKDSVIFVPAGQTVILRNSVRDQVDPNINKQDFRVFMANASAWTAVKRENVTEKFFSSEEKVPSVNEILNAEYLKGLTPTAREHALASLRVFQVTGSFRYDVISIKGQRVSVKVSGESKLGSGRSYRSYAERAAVPASKEKALIILEGNRLLHTSKGDIAIIGAPIVKDGRTIALNMMLGRYDESYPSDQKPVLLRGKLNEAIKRLKDKGITDIKKITSHFMSFSWEHLLEYDVREIATQIQKMCVE